MASVTNTREVLQEFHSLIRLYKDGTVERLGGTDFVPASVDPLTGVQSKDVLICPDTGVSARIFIPKSSSKSEPEPEPESATPDQKLPLLVYFHGGGFCIGSTCCAFYHEYLNSVVAEANVVVVSVDYRLAPEHPLPTAYDDSWVALKWVFGDGSDPWLTRHVDFQRVFLAGDSAGGNIAHHMAMRAGSEKSDGMDLLGVILFNPSVWGSDLTVADVANPEMKSYIDSLWKLVCPGSSGSDDPLINLTKDPGLSGLGCKRVLLCVAEKDMMRDRHWSYYEAMKKSEWGGEVELMETEGEDHVFHLFNPTAEKAVDLLKKVCCFLNTEKAE